MMGGRRNAAAVLAVSLLAAGCAAPYSSEPPLPDDWDSASESAEEVVVGRDLWRDLIYTMTDIISFHRIGPNSAARFYAYTSLAAWEAWDAHPAEEDRRGIAAWAASEAGTRAFGPEAAGTLQAMARRNSTDPGSRGLGERIGAETLDQERILSFRSGQEQTIVEAEEGEWSWEPTWPERRSFQFPGWKDQPLLVGGSSVCRLPEPPLQRMEQEARQMLQRIREEGPESYATSRAVLWLAGPGTPTPSGQWLLIAAEAEWTGGLADAEGLRLLAAMSVAAHDASILTWQEKHRWNLARPETMFARWAEEVPLSPRSTPNHPSYPSAHSAFSAAAAESIRTFAGDGPIELELPPEAGFDNPAQLFRNLAEAVADASLGRVDAGFHYPTDTTAGHRLGRCVAEVVAERFGGAT